MQRISPARSRLHADDVPIRRAIVRSPARNFGDGITTAALGTPSFEKACEQHAAYCDVLKAAGAAVIALAPDAEHPDAHFVEDAAIPIGGRVIVTRPGARSRRGESDALHEPLARYFDVIERIVAPGTVDGGDVCEAGERVCVGISHRTNRAGARQLRRSIESAGRRCVLVDIRDLPGILHLKSGMAYLGDGCFAAVDALLPRLDLPPDRVVRVTPGEEYAANCVRVNDVLLVASGHPHLLADFARLGYATVALDVSEFRKMDGGLSCLSLRF
ncbi:MAG: arginine deiminase family protein [Candidatus Tumulicola sp.]